MQGHPGLETLVLSECLITDRSAEILGSFPQLKNLYLDRVPITDQTMKHIAQLENLEKLDIQRTKVTDAGVLELHTLTKLREIRIGDQYRRFPLLITQRAVSKIKRQFPECKVYGSWNY